MVHTSFHQRLYMYILGIQNPSLLFVHSEVELKVIILNLLVIITNYYFDYDIVTSVVDGY